MYHSADTDAVRIVLNYRILFDADVPRAGLPKLANLMKSGNRAPQAKRPKDRDFVIGDLYFPEDFYRADVTSEGKVINYNEPNSYFEIL